MGQKETIIDIEKIADAYRQYMRSRSVNEDEDLTDVITALVMDRR